jgi:hypothetical protein
MTVEQAIIPTEDGLELVQHWFESRPSDDTAARRAAVALERYFDSQTYAGALTLEAEVRRGYLRAGVLEGYPIPRLLEVLYHADTLDWILDTAKSLDLSIQQVASVERHLTSVISYLTSAEQLRMLRKPETKDLREARANLKKFSQWKSAAHRAKNRLIVCEALHGLASRNNVDFPLPIRTPFQKGSTGLPGSPDLLDGIVLLATSASKNKATISAEDFDNASTFAKALADANDDMRESLDRLVDACTDFRMEELTRRCCARTSNRSSAEDEAYAVALVRHITKMAVIATNPSFKAWTEVLETLDRASS